MSSELGMLLQEIVKILKEHDNALGTIVEVESIAADCIRVSILLSAAAIVMSVLAILLVVGK